MEDVKTFKVLSHISSDVETQRKRKEQTNSTLDVVIRLPPQIRAAGSATTNNTGGASKSTVEGDVVLFYPLDNPPLCALLASHAAFAKLGKQIKSTSRREPIVELRLMKTKETLQGNHIAARFLARLVDASAGTTYAGANIFSASQIDFFLDFAQCELDHVDDSLNASLDALDKHLASRTYFVDYGYTLADFAVWGALKGNQKLSSVAFDKLPNLNRWYNMCSSAEQFQPALQCLTRVQKTTTPQKGKEEKKQAAKDGDAKTETKIKDQGGSFDIELPGAVKGQVVTRFPPEPSGYLHIGHAKAVLLNDTIAKIWDGKMLLRFDDTNPSKEKDEYVENIMRDLKTLGVTWAVLTHTSDHFEKILDYGTQMLAEGKAYIDDTPVEEMRKERGEGQASKNRDRSIADNLRLWEEMKQRTPLGRTCAFRGKIDMSSQNGTLRDPVFFRCNETPHHRTGTKYKVYPTYDFACPIVDSIEGVTHALRTTEYHDRNAQYYWVIDALRLRKPHIWDFSRLNFKYTLMSKRKLQWFVDQKLVDGWYDPRFPTVQGIMRRGLTVEALREFIRAQGASKAVALMEWDKLWSFNQTFLEPKAHRYFAVNKDTCVLVKLVNAQKEGVIEEKQVPLLPKDPAAGSRSLAFTSSVFIDQDDAKELKEKDEVTLLNWGNVIVQKINSKDGVVTGIEATLNPQGNPKATKRYLHWVPALPNEQLAQIQMVEFFPLITKEKLEDEDNLTDFVNYKSKVETTMIGEPSLKIVNKNDIIQLQRRGFFRCDEKNPFVLFKVPDSKKTPAASASAAVSAPKPDKPTADKKLKKK